MVVTGAGFAFLFDVMNLTARGDLTVPANDAAASERRETKKPNETHDILRLERQQVVYRP